MFSKNYLNEVVNILQAFQHAEYIKVIQKIQKVQLIGGRVFFLGVGGSAANCSHAVNDFRKILGIESYTPTDNVSEITARTNDEGWETIFVEWLKISKLTNNDLIIILSVGGGNKEKSVSINLINAIDYAKSINTPLVGIVGKSDGYTARRVEDVIIINSPNSNHITPHSESLQSVILHMIVSDPTLQRRPTKWESLNA